ncbi:MAG TPA: hypothetical protein VLD58_12055 [Gemmatimonadales bacterium]|nr:hypothetical protein [Gemmatimonadales bacterium]
MKQKPAAGSGTTGSSGSGGNRPSSAEAAQAGLAALLASEDLLFRDPFADFTPSAR